MKSRLLVAPAAFFVLLALPFSGETVSAQVDKDTISSCSLSPATATLAPGETLSAVFGYVETGPNPYTWSEIYADSQLFNSFDLYAPGAAAQTLPYDIAVMFLNGATSGVVRFDYYAVDTGGSKVGSVLCSQQVTVSSEPIDDGSPEDEERGLPETGIATGVLMAVAATLMVTGWTLRRRAMA